MKAKIPSTDEKSAALKRVLDSRMLHRAVRLRGFLEYVGDHAIRGDSEPIHEVDIGRAVFERPDDYTPAEDSIVRVEARSLRKKLEAYYAEEGASDKVVITIPKGAYAPKFEYRKLDSVDDLEPGGRPGRGALIAALGMALAVSLAANLWFTLAEPRSSTSATSSTPDTARSPLWSALFQPGQETYIVLPDSIHAFVQDVSHRSFSLREYLAPDFSPRNAFGEVLEADASIAPQLSWRQYTGWASSRLAARILRHSSGSRATASIHFARHMHTRDFKGRNLILLGSTRSNPWRELFKPQLNFTFEYDEAASRPYIRNASPLDGEQETYVAGVGSDTLETIYGVVSLVENLSGDGYVLMIAGTSMEGTEAAGEFLLDATAGDRGFANLLDAHGRLQPFEVLMRSARMEGTSRGAEVIAQRVRDRE